MEVILFGEFDAQIDANGRINVPRKLHLLFEKGGFLMRAFNGQSLVFLTPPAFARLKTSLDALGATSDGEEARRFVACGTDARLDGQGRLSVASRLRQWTGLSKDVIMVAMDDKVEIWDAARWEAYNSARFTEERLQYLNNVLNPPKVTVAAPIEAAPAL